MRKVRVGVIFGGRSSEHEISLRSALTVISALDRDRYEVVPIGIAPDGRWYLEEDANRLLIESTQRLGALKSEGLAVSLLPHPDTASEIAGIDSPINRRVDVIFPVLHGTHGEDGTIQGLIELAGIPYVGAGVLGSAIGMDKAAQKRLLREADLPVVDFHWLRRREYLANPEAAAAIAARLGYPVFVKPNALGSSVGVSKVARADELRDAVDDAFQYDRKVLIEAACIGREFECAVLGNDEPRASIVGEIITKAGYDFYSYESKYVDPNGAQIRIPANLPREEAERVRALSVAAFQALDLRGMARVDFLARADLSKIFINEVNTIPGFTSISMYPKLWEASGLPLSALVDKLIELALEEHRARADLKITYQPKL
jgi:D-alanine-D-alanine ligase